MKQLIRNSAVAAMLTASLGVAQAALIGHWKFDDEFGETAVDSANGNNAIWQGGGGSNTWVAGLIGGATLHNDENGGNGNEHFITGTIAEMVGATQLTMSIWFNQNAEENNNSTYNGLMMSRAIDPTVGQSWGIALEDNGAPRHIDARVSNQATDSSDTIPGESGWHHVAMSWDGMAGTVSVYVDGVFDVATGGNSIVAGPIAAFSDLRFGDDPCCGGREFTGSLDDASLWNEVLTATQISNIYNGGLQGFDAPTSIPEPASGLMALLGGVLLVRRRR